MNWEQSKNRSPHVERFPTTPLFPTTPSQNSTSFWPTPSSQSGLNHTPNPQLSEELGGEHFRSWRGDDPTFRPDIAKQGRGQVGELEARLATHTHHYSISKNETLPPVLHSQRLSSSTLRSPYESQAPFQTPQSAKSRVLQTPPPSAHRPELGLNIHGSTAPMADPRRLSSHGQRPVMGPPETPSRGMMHASPGLFPNLQFSPDLFSHQSMDPASAPVYPQQRLFWDPSATPPIASTPQSFHTPAPFPDEYHNSFASTSTVIPSTYAHPPEPQQYDLPAISRSMSASYMDTSVFPAPFQTSPRMPLPQQDNPTLFLSSPARRFGGTEPNTTAQARRNVPELPAYHHQIQESMREKELAKERRRSRASKLSADDDLIMKSVRRALSPSKQPRPGLQRSNTHTGVRSHGPNGRRQNQVAFVETASVASNGSTRSGRPGRSSPVWRIREHERQLSSGSIGRNRTSMSLAIDANGVARAIMTSLPEDDNDGDAMDMDNSASEASSPSDSGDKMLYSFAADQDDFLGRTSLGDAREELRANTYLSMGPDKVMRPSHTVSNIDPRLAPHSRFPESGTARHSRTGTLNTDPESNGSGNAKQALRAIMQDRSRSTSSHEQQSSGASMQFHSSPPVQSNQFGAYNGSPTTITDPDLATPSTDADSLSSVGATRCVCNSSSPDGNIMIQCDSCSKWLHAKCVGLKNRNLPDVYVCTFCERTPMRQTGGRGSMRSSLHANRSPLAHKSQRHR